MASTTEETIQRIADELAIRDLVARFANCCSPPDSAAFRKLWLPDTDSDKAVWTLLKPFAMSETGVDNIVAMVEKLLAPWDFFVQLVHSGVVEIDGDRATGRFILREIAKGKEERYYNNFAIYEDEFRKVESKWYFSERVYKYMFLDQDAFPGDVCPPIKDWYGGK